MTDRRILRSEPEKKNLNRPVGETVNIALERTKGFQKSKAALFLLSFISSMLGGTVSSLISTYLPDVAAELLHNNSQQVNNNISSMINAVALFGWTAGGITWGYFCDSIGRKKSFLYSTLCYGLATILTGISPNWFLVILFRFFSGFGIGGVLVTTTMLVSEEFVAKQRAVLLGILSISIPLGFFSSGIITYLVSAWRWAFMIGVIPVFIGLLGSLTITESVKWKEKKISDNEFNLSSLYYGEYRKRLWMGAAVFGAPLIGLWATVSWLPFWIHDLPKEVETLQPGALAMMLVGIGGLTGGFISGWIVHTIGIKRTLLVCFGASFVLSFILFFLTRKFGYAAYWQVGFLSVFFGISQGALSIYIPALFPSSIGATATGLCFNIGRIFTAAAVFFIGSLVQIMGGYGPSIFYFSLVFLIAFAVTLFNKPQSLQQN
jgi:predicted MFS family arabinose efflux permease